MCIARGTMRRMKKLLAICALAALAACAKKPAAAPMNAATKVKGTVVETMNAGGVTYVRLKTDTGERWVVTSPAEIDNGTAVTAQVYDNIAFAKIDGGAAPAGHGAAKTPEIGNVKVDKAEGADAKTVAEIWATKAALKDHRVVVRGTVVKFLPSIMGKNWLHVRDGSGTHAKGDDDIAVISDDQAKVGSVVTLTGTVRLDKDFGAGYSYPVIIEDAKLK